MYLGAEAIPRSFNKRAIPVAPSEIVVESTLRQYFQ